MKLRIHSGSEMTWYSWMKLLHGFIKRCERIISVSKFVFCSEERDVAVACLNQYINCSNPQHVFNSKICCINESECMNSGAPHTHTHTFTSLIALRARLMRVCVFVYGRGCREPSSTKERPWSSFSSCGFPKIIQ